MDEFNLWMDIVFFLYFFKKKIREMTRFIFYTFKLEICGFINYTFLSLFFFL
ncbi:uncharacterized protein BX663DRAFT_504101, partial [Cokeromyces recurvatus]|uniref:uncharacterized protein n=1 Tax=Cokeromyces recurvatus TaxID=90255 RepID=UPI0022201681